MKKVFALLSGLLLLMALAGCGNESGRGTTTIKWSVWDVKDASVEHDLVAAFEKENPGIKVELTNIASADYQDKITTMLAAGNKTDVITMKNAKQYTALAYSGALKDISKGLKDTENYKLAADAYDTFYTEDGKIYAQPIKADSWYLFYNKDLFDEKKLPYPENLTWEEYVELAGKLTTEKSKNKTVYGTYQVVWPSVVQAPAYAQSDPEYTKPDFNWLTDYYNTALKLQDKGYAQDFATNSTASEAAGYETSFENGETAMLIMGTWYAPVLIENIRSGDTNVNWGLAQLPQKEGTETPVVPAAITGVAINKRSEHKQAAQKFVDFLSSEEGAEIYSKKGVFPAISNETITNNLLDIKAMASDDLTKATLNAKKELKGELPIGKDVSDVNTILEEEHTIIMNEEVSLKKGIAEMQRRVKALD